MITTDEEFVAGTTKVVNARKNGAKLVLQDFVTASVKAGKALSEHDYAPNNAASSAAAAPADDVEDEKPKRKGRAAAQKAASTAAAIADTQAEEEDDEKEQVGTKRKGRAAAAAAAAGAAAAKEAPAPKTAKGAAGKVCERGHFFVLFIPPSSIRASYWKRSPLTIRLFAIKFCSFDAEGCQGRARQGRQG